MIEPVLQHPSSADVYIRHGWQLVPIPPGTKGPATKGWQLKQNMLTQQSVLPPGYGIGLAHAYSGTMALDIDVWDRAALELLKYGIDLSSLYSAPDAVVIDSGRPGHGKLLYAMPFGLALPSKKLIDTNDSAHRYNYLDFRCATSTGTTAQDVLPPSIHPETNQPYRWAGAGHWSRLPVIPMSLLDMWRSLIDQPADEDTASTPRDYHQSINEITQALNCIPADVSREEWIMCGMALHAEGNQVNQLSEMFTLWDNWSQKSLTKYPGDRVMRSQWASFRDDKASKVTLGSLYALARDHGWTRPPIDASVLFNAVKPDSPDTVIASLRPSPPDIDLSMWPSTLSRRAQEISESVGCDPLVPLFAGLAAACGAIDARTRLEIVNGWQVPPILWLMTIGSPAQKKTPGSKPVLSPLKRIEFEDHARYEKAKLDWEGKEAAYAASKKQFLEWAASPDALLSNTTAPTVPELPPQPVPLRITVSDVTSQKLVRHAAERPRGLLCYLDEMNSWARKLNDPRSGEDRSAWTVAYESEYYEMDRVGAGSIRAENYAVAIYGNMQPRVFSDSLAGLASDGTLQRFIPAILRPRRWEDNPIPECLTNAAEWENTLRLLHALPATVYRLSSHAYAMFRDFQRWYRDAMEDEQILQTSDIFQTSFGKIEGTCARLALLFHVLDNPFAPEIDVDTMQRTIKVIRGYVVPSIRYSLAEYSVDGTFDTWMTEHIAQHSTQTTISLAEIRRSAKRQIVGMSLQQSEQLITGAMWNLEQAKWVTRLPDDMTDGRRSAVWGINPSLNTLHADYRKKVIAAKQRQREEIYRLSPKTVKPVKGYVAD